MTWEEEQFWLNFWRDIANKIIHQVWLDIFILMKFLILLAIFTEFKFQCFLKIVKFPFIMRKLQLGKTFVHGWMENFQRNPDRAGGMPSVQKQAPCLLLDLELMDAGGVEESSVDHREGNLSKEYGKGAWAVALQSREWCKPQISRKPGFISSTAFGTTCLNFPCR